MAYLFLDFLFIKRSNFDGKLRADEFTQTAVHTFVGVGGIRRVIPFTVELRRLLQDMFRAKLDAKPASFASFLEDFYLTTDGLYLALVQCFSPIFHNILSLFRYFKGEEELTKTDVITDLGCESICVLVIANAVQMAILIMALTGLFSKVC